MRVFHDAFGEECKRILDVASSEKPKPASTTVAATSSSSLTKSGTTTHDDTSKSDFHSELDFGGSDSVDAHFRSRDKDFERYSSSHSRDRYDDDREKDKHRHERDRDRDRDRDRGDRDRDRDHRHDKKDRKYEKEKRHHSSSSSSYHHKSDKDKDRRDRDHRSHHRDKKERDRDSSKYRDSYKKVSDREYTSSSVPEQLAYSKPSVETNFGSSGYTNIPTSIKAPPSSTYEQSYAYSALPGTYPAPSHGSYHYVPSASIPSGHQPTWHHMPWHSGSSVPSTIIPPPPADSWQSSRVAPLPPLPNINIDAEENWDDEVDDPPPPPLPPTTPPRSASTKKRREKEKEKKIDDEDQATIDLDTRIAMMFKEKSFGAAPPFLQMDDSDTDAEHNKTDDNDDHPIDTKSKSSPANRTPPSPNKATIKSCENKSKSSKPIRKEQIVDAGASDISSSDDEILHRKGAYSPTDDRKANRGEDDKMSLSSLSSNDDKDDKPPLPSTQPPLPPTPPKSQMFPPPPSYLYPPGTQPYYYPASTPAVGPPGYTSNLYQPQYMPQHPYMQPYVPGFTHLFTPNSYMSPTTQALSTHQKKTVPQRDPYEVTINSAIDRVTAELKQILKKDFNKKMIENTAYKKFETWWDDKEKTKGAPNSSIVAVEKINGPTPKRIPDTKKAPDINQLLNNNLENFDNYSGISLGLRAQIPKLPSFRRIRKQPSPVPLDEDSCKGLSDQEEMVQGSESETEPEQQPQRTKVSFSDSVDLSKIPRKRKGSTSTITSSSEDDSSSDDSDSDSDSSSLSEVGGDDTPKLTHKVKSPRPVETVAATKERRIYSDTESDADDIVTPRPPSPTIKSTIKSKGDIYSDTSSEDETGTHEKKNDAPANLVKNIQDSVKKPTISISDDYSSQSPKPPRTPGRESPAPRKSVYDYDRIYSDSEEEREYQEKRRRNTQYMEEIEREFKEEQLKELQSNKKKEIEKEEALMEIDEEPLPEKAPSPGDPLTPCITKPPPTPGAKIPQIMDPISNYVKKLDENKQIASTSSAATTTISVTAANNLSADKVPELNGITPYKNVPDTYPPTPDILYEDANRSVKLSPSASSDGGSSQESQASQASQIAMMDHCYSLPPSASPSISSLTSPPAQQPPAPFKKSEQQRVLTPLAEKQSTDLLAHDHGYTSNATSATVIPPLQQQQQQKQGPGRPKKDSKRYIQKQVAIAAALAQEEAIKEAARKKAAAPFVPEERYTERDMREEMILLYEFLTKGIDKEDIEYLKQSYEYLLQDDANSYWLNATHWMDHCVTDRALLPPPTKKRKREDENLKHASGSARTEGFYKVDLREKAKFKYHHAKLQAGETAAHLADATSSKLVSKMQGASREARSNQRRLLTAFGASTESELLKFNQLKFRKKQLKFAKSAIHDWGLFAMEPIAADEMVIEYVGQMIRPVVADLRETKYEAIGIGSSYLFRIDLETIIDATKCGNLARFINHSCNVSQNDLLYLYNVYR